MKRAACCGLMASILLSGCASYKNELVFGESSDFSIGFHPAPAGGLDFNLGYKQTDIAVVPVGVIDSSGAVRQRSASAQENEGNPSTKKDAVSVFGQFSASSRTLTEPASPRRVTFGRFFATGIAAQRLAEGYASGWNQGLTVQDPQAAEAAAKAAADAAMASAEAARVSAEAARVNTVSGMDEHVTRVAAKAGKEAGAKAAQDALAQTPQEETANASKVLPPLVFGQYDMVGLNAAYSGTPSTFDLALGYSGRNIAIMPLFGEGKNGFESLGSGAGDTKDAFSVVGQFAADTATNAPDVGLNRFFATGVAAQKLSEGLRSRIAAFISQQTKAELTKSGSHQAGE